MRLPAVFHASPAKEEENAHFKAFVTFPIQKLSGISGALEVQWARGSPEGKLEGFGLFYYYKTRIEQNLPVFHHTVSSSYLVDGHQMSRGHGEGSRHVHPSSFPEFTLITGIHRNSWYFC